MTWFQLTSASSCLYLICSIKELFFGSKGYTKELKLSNVQVFSARLACFGQLGLISDPQISSKLQNRINDPKGLENKIYTMMKGRETFDGDHTVPITSLVKFNMFY